MHPRSKQWHLIDYIITRQRDLKDVHVTESMRGADCWSDHRLVRARVSLTTQRSQICTEAATALGYSSTESSRNSATLSANRKTALELAPIVEGVVGSKITNYWLRQLLLAARYDYVGL